MNAPRLAAVLSLAIPFSQALAQTGTLRPPVRGASAPREQAPPRETSIVSYEGFIEVQRSGEQTRRQVTAAPFPLADGDKVHTYRRGEAVIMFKDGSKVTLGAYTVFTVEIQSPGGITLSLSLGRLRALVSRLKGREFKVRTAVAVASVRGTEFEIGFSGAGLGDVAVHEGLVAVANLRGDEILLAANQRLEVFADRMGRIEHFEGRPERGGPPKDDKKPDPRDRRPPPDDRRPPPSGDRAQLRQALEREIGHQMSREAIESRAAFDHRNALYQEGKTLIDAFGQRVRLEEFITRPDPRSFKHVTLNFRDQRTDFSSLEVTANAPLPPDLKLAGDLWFRPGPAKPPFYAVKQRWTVGNGIDTVSRMSLDGDSMLVTAPSIPVLDPVSGNFIFTPLPARQTVFAHQYEFINGDPGVLNGIYFAPLGTNRPNDLPSMMWHMVPLKIEVRQQALPTNVVGNYFDYAFKTRDGLGGSTGKMFVDVTFSPFPGLSRFIQARHYMDFVDTNGDTILDFLELATPGQVFGLAGICADGSGPSCVFHDKAVFATWNAGLNNGLGGLQALGTPIAGSGTQDNGPTSGDTTFFADYNGDGIHQGGSTMPEFSPLTNVTLPTGGDPALIQFAAQKHRDFLQADNITINDLGQVQPLPPLGTDPVSQQNQIGDVFQTLNFQRVLTSSRFMGRKIDLVFRPNIFLTSGLLSARHSAQGAPGPGAEPPGAPGN